MHQSLASGLLVEHQRMAGRSVHPRGVHHGHQTVRSTGEQLVPGRTLSGCEYRALGGMLVPRFENTVYSSTQRGTSKGQKAVFLIGLLI